MLKTVKTILGGLDGTVRLIGVGANLALVTAFGWATNKFQGKATAAWDKVGEIPAMDIPSLIAWLTDPAIVDKLIAMGSLWVYAILAIGCGWMTILGVRWSYHLVLSIIQSLRTQADKALA